MSRQAFAVTIVLALATPASVAAPSGVAAYRALGLRPQEVLTSTVLNSQVVPGGKKQVVCVATYLTGKKEKEDAVNIRVGVFDAFGDGLVPLYTRDLGQELGHTVANGDLQVLDIDLDGVNEIIVSFDSYEDPLIDKRVAEVILHDGTRLVAAWSGIIEYDATRAARSVPRERRDRYVREFDWASTMRTHGASLFFTKRVVAVAGERLPEPRVLQESFELRGGPEGW